MGLDAVVYKHRSKLPVDPEHVGLRIEETTGEWYSETGNVPESIRAAGVEALHKRLGNVSLIAALGREVQLLLPGTSVLLSKVARSRAVADGKTAIGSIPRADRRCDGGESGKKGAQQAGVGGNAGCGDPVA